MALRSIVLGAALLCTSGLFAQMATLRGLIHDPEGEPVPFANAALLQGPDSTLAKVEVTDEGGHFRFEGVAPGNYQLKVSYVGAADLKVPDIKLDAGETLDLGVLAFLPAAIELAEATVTARRALVEIKPDRTVFNVEGTINSVGSDALSLLRKAPGVTVDNNDNVSVLGRSGVLLYVDGKRLPLSGQELKDYLQNLPAEQIDRIDIITNPGAKYEAEGNAGIIDIRLKKNEGFGANGSLSSTYSQGQLPRANLNTSGNYRNRWLNAFGTAGLGYGDNFWRAEFLSTQNDIQLGESIYNRNRFENANFRFGTDFFLAEKHTLGILVSGRWMEGDNNSYNRIALSPQANPGAIDSVLIANTTAENSRQQQTYNLNYRFDNGQGRTLNIDLDYGRYRNQSERYQPNRYYDPTETVVLTQRINAFDTPSDIDIYTASADYEQDLWGGRFALGTRLSRVVSDNTFLFFDVEDDTYDLNERNSNEFEYIENVYAGYFSYQRELGEKWNLSLGLRAEQTDATGDLRAFLPELQEPPVELNYLSWFPNAGLTWQLAPKHLLALNYGRRINRPDYNVLNPFNNKLSELSYEKGNPFLQPEIVNNVELGYTLAQRYNFKLAYSLTTDQITRLIAPDEDDDRANFITWANLAEQHTVSFNVSAPVQITKWWNAYINANASYLDNQADYGGDAIVDVQAFTYNIFQQHTFNLPWKLTGEVSGWFAGPGVWGGVFKYESQWSLDLGLQRKFFNEQLNVRISASDLFYESGWDGTSSFNGLVSTGFGRWDSRRVSLSLSYSFGNQKVKSRRRQTGIEEAAGRVGGE